MPLYHIIMPGILLNIVVLTRATGNVPASKQLYKPLFLHKRIELYKPPYVSHSPSFLLSFIFGPSTNHLQPPWPGGGGDLVQVEEGEAHHGVPAVWSPPPQQLI